MDSFAKSLKKIRSTAGLSRSELGRRVGISSRAICKFESGAGNPSVLTLVALAKVLNVSLDDLIFGKKK